MIAQVQTFSLVPLPTQAEESTSQKVRRLQAEARDLAREHVGALRAALAEVEMLAVEISGGGEAYPPGVRDIARRLAQELGPKAQTLAVLSGRAN